jgi:uncharacterized membrane protein
MGIFKYLPVRGKLRHLIGRVLFMFKEGRLLGRFWPKEVWQIFALTLVFLNCVRWFLVFFSIPVCRQVFGLVYLLFVPGTIIIQLLDLEKLSKLEVLLITVGLSVVFLMIAGLLLNELAGFAGFSDPLQPSFLMVAPTILTAFGVIISYRRRKALTFSTLLTLKHKPLILVFFGVVVMSVAGSISASLYGNNSVLLFLLILIPSLFVWLIFSKEKNLEKIYAIAIFVIALALLYHSSLISRFVFSSDSPIEYAVFNNTLENQIWSVANPYRDLLYGRLNSMLSITILPTAISGILNLDPTWLFKLIYPFIFAFVPVCLYQLWQKYIGAKYAFIAAFLFVAQQTFYTEMLGLNRQMIAEFFFVLLLLVVLNDNLTSVGKVTLFTVFGFGLVTSHYGLSEIFLLFILAAFVYSLVRKQVASKVTLFSAMIFPLIMFSWYIYTSGAAVFDSILEFSSYVWSQLGDFLNPASRGQTVLLGLGLEGPPTLWNSIGRAFAYVTQILIVLGFVGLLTRRVKVRFDKSYLTLTFIAMVFLGALVVVPGLANTLNMTRFYHILLFFLAPLFVLGAVFLVKLVDKRRRTELLVLATLLVVLVPYFLFQTSFVYEVTGTDSWSVPLSRQRMEISRLYRNFGYVDEYSALGAVWMSENLNITKSNLYADSPSLYNVLTSYGMIYRGFIKIPVNTTNLSHGDLLYLSAINTQEGIMFSGTTSWNLTDMSFDLNNLNKLYANGRCEIFEDP